MATLACSHTSKGFSELSIVVVGVGHVLTLLISCWYVVYCNHVLVWPVPLGVSVVNIPPTCGLDATSKWRVTW